MLFQAKNKTHFIDRNEHAWLIARTSASVPPMQLESIVEVPIADEQALKAELQGSGSTRGASAYKSAICAVYPPRRILRRVSVDLKKVKEAGYLNEVCTQQLRIEPDKYSLALLSASEGKMVDPGRITEKELLICGIPSEDLNLLQDSLLQSGIYPTAIELGSVAMLGAAVDSVRFSKTKTPILFLEIGNENTQSYIVTPSSAEATRSIPFGIESMIPIVQKKLGLKDEESARKLFYSNTFDFTSMGGELVQRLLKELQSSIGFYEVQTGQSITHVVCVLNSEKLTWIEASIAASLGLSVMKFDLKAWLHSHQVSLSNSIDPSTLGMRHFGLLSLLVSYQTASTNGTPS